MNHVDNNLNNPGESAKQSQDTPGKKSLKQRIAAALFPNLSAVIEYGKNKDGSKNAEVDSDHNWKPMLNGSVLVGFTKKGAAFNLQIKDRIKIGKNIGYIVQQTVPFGGEQKYAFVNQDGEIDKEWGFFSKYNLLPASNVSAEAKKSGEFFGKILIQKEKNGPTVIGEFKQPVNAPVQQSEDSTANVSDNEPVVPNNSDEQEESSDDVQKKADARHEAMELLENKIKDTFVKVGNMEDDALATIELENDENLKGLRTAMYEFMEKQYEDALDILSNDDKSTLESYMDKHDLLWNHYYEVRNRATIANFFSSLAELIHKTTDIFLEDQQETN